jgi:hypothetical protein
VSAVPLRRVVEGIEVEAFSGQPLAPDEREELEAALTEAVSARG